MIPPCLGWSLSSSESETDVVEPVDLNLSRLGELAELTCPSPEASMVSTYKSLVMLSSWAGALALVMKCSTCLKWAPQMSLTTIWCLCLPSLSHALVPVGNGLTFGAIR